MLDSIVTATRAYAAHMGGVDFAFDLPRLLQFQAIKIVKGLAGITSLRRAWGRHPAVRNTLIASIMSRDDFVAINRWLHLPASSKNDDHGRPNFFYKVNKFASM